MRTIDTSAWIEWFSRTETGRAIRPLIPEQEACIVPTIVQLELSKWLFRHADYGRTNRILAFTTECQVVPLTSSLAIRAGEVSRDCKLSTADAIIYATALEYGAELVTCDAHFKELANVIYIQKITS